MTDLQQSVTNFINFFSDTVDRAAVVSYSSCSSVPVTMQKPFKARVNSATLALVPLGGTASSSGMADGWAQIRNFTVPSGEVVQKVMVFCTDGFANTFSNGFNCGIRNIYEDGTTLFDPNNSCNQGRGSCTIPATIPSANPTFSGYTTINTSSTAQMDAEAKARVLDWANQARAAGVFVYSIGLNCDSQAAPADFLAQVANVDGVVNQDQPIGLSLIAPTSQAIHEAWVTIAKAILLRLTQ
jgi:hypothetical protein